MRKDLASLKDKLDRFYRDYDFDARLEHDPILFPRRYSDPDDIAVAGFIASSFAYGKVTLFFPIIKNILAPGGKHPAQFIKNFNIRKDRKYFKNLSYRFNREKDIICLVFLLSEVTKRWGSLKNLFYHFYKPDHEDVRIAMTGLLDALLSINTFPVYGQNSKPDGLVQLLPLPQKGSACKRMNLYLRWMVRKRDIDLGIWSEIPASKLIIPLDTHIARISKCLGLTDRKSSDWKTAKEITDSLRELNPRDPLKYDFALCHHGISGMCRGEISRDLCIKCRLYHI